MAFDLLLRVGWPFPHFPLARSLPGVSSGCMDIAEQEAFRPVIEQRMSELRRMLAAGSEECGAVAPDRAIGRLSRLDSMQMQQMALANKRLMEEELRALAEALQRIDAGRYGRCELCGRDIARERLECLPAAPCCVPCMEKSAR